MIARCQRKSLSLLGRVTAGRDGNVNAIGAGFRFGFTRPPVLIGDGRASNSGKRRLREMTLFFETPRARPMSTVDIPSRHIAANRASIAADHGPFAAYIGREWISAGGATAD
jgi:hypothetical protein